MMFATVGLGVSDFGYRISHDSFRWCFDGMTMAIAKENQETVSFQECIYTSFWYCNCSSVDSSLAESSSLHLQSFSPTHPCLYIYTTPGLYRIDMGVCLALWQWA